MSEIIRVQDLTVGFETKDKALVAVDNFSFELYPGETLALLGESGCGKSLTALALMRLLPDDAAYGQDSQAMFGQTDLLQLPEQIMRTLRGRRIAMIFQEPMTALNPVLTIAAQLAETLCKNTKRSQAALHQEMLALLTEVDISDPQRRLKQYPHQLSGGQKQRVVIAMALAGRPDVLIADEPTTALDSATQTQILGLLKRLQARHQMSIILITHDIAVVQASADRVCVMYAGQLLEIAPVASFLHQPKHPYVQQLLMSLPTSAKRGERLHAISGSVPTLDNRPSGCRFHPRCAHVFERCRTVVPELQPVVEGRLVRCHLYPDNDSLPPLPDIKSPLLNPADNPATKSFGRDVDEREVVTMSVRDLSVYFYPKRQLFSRKPLPFKAVDGFSCVLHKGKTLALVGESGCGKSTVSKAILRLIPMTSGEIVYRGVDIQSLHGNSLKAFRKKVQMIFQDPFSSMNPRMTVDDILAEGMQAQGMRRSLIRTKQLELLDQVNLPKNSLNRYPHQFSGGQRQRICIARALATSPEILVCDEPTSALDVSVQAQILNLLKSLQNELGLSYLFITHNMDVVSYMADEVLKMHLGRVVVDEQ